MGVRVPHTHHHAASAVAVAAVPIPLVPVPIAVPVVPVPDAVILFVHRVAVFGRIGEGNAVVEADAELRPFRQIDLVVPALALVLVQVAVGGTANGAEESALQKAAAEDRREDRAAGGAVAHPLRLELPFPAVAGLQPAAARAPD